MSRLSCATMGLTKIPGPAEKISHNVRAGGNNPNPKVLPLLASRFVFDRVKVQRSGKTGNKARHYTKVSQEYNDWIRVKKYISRFISMQ